VAISLDERKGFHSFAILEFRPVGNNESAAFQGTAGILLFRLLL